ncbi:SprT family zinc-dependent metalloprotease [Myroides odoratimimus]|uniref:M48 family metallopeptidase n=1 Tax=Myroides odoratimimus TaxID=76832 RepID=UPI003100E9FA
MRIEYTYGKRKIEAEILYSNRKTIDLRVFPQGHVVITVPEGTPIETILNKVKPKSKWVISQIRTFELYRPFTKERLYIPGETHRYLGRQYKLVINKIDRGKTELKLNRGLFSITTASDNVEAIINKFYKAKANVVFTELLDKLLVEFPQFKNYDISLSHRFMKKRWGSCSMDGKIILNTELIKASKACIEYVILHELCHLIHPNHSKEFYKELFGILPNWEKLKLKLEKDLA